MSRVSAFPDPHSLARDELTALLKKLISREQVVSDERRTTTESWPPVGAAKSIVYPNAAPTGSGRVHRDSASVA